MKRVLVVGAVGLACSSCVSLEVQCYNAKERLKVAGEKYRQAEKRLFAVSAISPQGQQAIWDMKNESEKIDLAEEDIKRDCR